MPANYYPAIIDRSESGFGVTFPDFPGCVAAGDTVQEAALNAEAALALHLEGMHNDGDEIPAASSLDDIEDVEGAEDVARLLVRADQPTKFSRVQVTLEDNLLAAIDAVAPNRSGFLAEAARAALKERTGFDPATMKARKIYVVQAKGVGKTWRICPHWTDTSRGRPVMASTYLEPKFGDPDEARSVAALVFGVDPRSVIVQPNPKDWSPASA